GGIFLCYKEIIYMGINYPGDYNLFKFNAFVRDSKSLRLARG
ncbi:unnamed protein product, partial [marine sediment metagenome]